MAHLAVPLLLGLPAILSSHPVIYKGGTAVFWNSQPGMLDLQANHSLTSWVAFGLEYLDDQMGSQNTRYGFLRTNVLVKRWFGEDSQANLYLSLGGGAEMRGVPVRAALIAALEADFETRSLYTAFKATAWGLDRVRPMLQARIGMAPYVGDYEALQAWLIAQAQYFPDAGGDVWTGGPLLRFFYRSVLWEMGAQIPGGWLLNGMVHF